MNNSILTKEMIKKLKENGRYIQCKSKNVNTKQIMKAKYKAPFKGKPPTGNGVSSIYTQ
jgi:hypothetical protein